MKYYDEYGDPRPARSRSKYKNTRKWCRGKEGVEHSPIVEISRPFHSIPNAICGNSPNTNYNMCYHHVACENCGKELQFTPDICPTTGLARKDRLW